MGLIPLQATATTHDDEVYVHVKTGTLLFRTLGTGKPMIEER